MNWQHSVSIGFGFACLFWFIVLLVAYIMDKKSFNFENTGKFAQFVIMEIVFFVLGVFLFVGGILTL